MPQNMLTSYKTPATSDSTGEAPKLVVLASGRGSNFEALALAVASGALPVEIVGLICNVAGAGALEIARAHKIPSQLISHWDYDSRENFDAAIIAAADAMGAEWVVMAGWMRLVTNTLLEHFDGQVINIHPSLLPAFRGLGAVEQALQAGVAITGCTVHLVELEVDAGEIIAQAAVPVLQHDTPDTLHARIQLAEHALYPSAIARAIQARRATSPPRS